MVLSLLPAIGRILIGLGAIQAAQTVTSTTTTAITATVTAPLTATVTTVVTATATGALTSTGALSPTLVPTVAPLPPPPVAATSIGDYLAQAGQSNLGGLSIAFLIASLLMLGAGAYFYFIGKRRWHRVQKLNYRLANFWGLVAMLLGAAGVIFVVLRIASIDGLNARIWLYLVLLVWLAFGVYAAYYFRARYPAELAKYNKTLKARSPARAGVKGSRPSAATPDREAGSAGNPRGTSPRGERRREKRR